MLDIQEAGIAEQAIGIDIQGMRRQLGIQPCTQATETAWVPIEATLRGQNGKRSAYSDQKLCISVSLLWPRHFLMMVTASNSLSLQTGGARLGGAGEAASADKIHPQGNSSTSCLIPFLYRHGSSLPMVVSTLSITHWRTLCRFNQLIALLVKFSCQLHLAELTSATHVKTRRR